MLALACCLASCFSSRLMAQQTPSNGAQPHAALLTHKLDCDTPPSAGTCRLCSFWPVQTSEAFWAAPRSRNGLSMCLCRSYNERQQDYNRARSRLFANGQADSSLAGKGRGTPVSASECSQHCHQPADNPSSGNKLLPQTGGGAFLRIVVFLTAACAVRSACLQCMQLLTWQSHGPHHMVSAAGQCCLS